MICPYCQQEMKAGYIPEGDAPVQWIPEGKRPALFKFAVAKDGVVLRGNVGISGYRAEAHYCPDCKIVIAPAG